MSSRMSVLLVAVYLCGWATGAVQTANHQFPPIEWNFQGKPIPETHWSPWLPLGTQQITRMSMGFRFSSGTIAVKCPVKLTFKYDTANAKSGKDLPIIVKAEMMGADYKTFESAFGISLPNRLQIGFFGVSGLPDVLPWWDLPWDFWDILGMVPLPEVGGVNIPAMLVSAKNNIGVNTGTKSALPLGSTAGYHDQRTLIAFDLKDKVKAMSNDLAPEVFNKLSSGLGSDGMELVLGMVKWAKGFSDNAQTVEFMTGLCGTAVEQLAGFASISIQGDPYFIVEGIQLRANVRCFIPNGKGSGVYTLYFTSSGQEQTLNFRDITPFVTDGDVLHIVVDDLMYEFRLRQGLNMNLGISLLTVPGDPIEKVVGYNRIERKFTANDYVLQIPLTKSDEVIQSLRTNPGYVSASVNWTSPNLPLKGTVKAYKGQQLVKTVTEPTFKNAHNVIVTGLSPKTEYRFAVDCVSPSGQTFNAGEVTTTTREGSYDRKDAVTIRMADGTDFKLTGASASADYTHIDFSWTTNKTSATMVLVSPSPDLGVNYVACAKLANGQVLQGWVTQGGTFEMVTDHQIRISNLDPGVTYYYNILSWAFTDDDPTKNPLVAVGKVGQIATKFDAPPQVKVKAQLQNTGAADVPVVVTKAGDASFRLALNTGSNGLTPPVTLDKGKQYTFSVSGHAWYQDVTSSPLNVSSTATGDLPDVVLNLAARPSPGGVVYDAAGAPVSGATVKLVGKTGYQTTTDGNGRYTFDGFTFTGAVSVEVSKADYATQRVAGRVEQLGLTRRFTADGCILPSALMAMEITVKKLTGTPISGMTVVIKEGTSQKGSVTTNAQGKATFTHNFNDNNANAHLLTVSVVPSTTSPILPTSTQVSVIGGEQRKLEINCPEDTLGPAITDISITQIANRNISVAFLLDDETATSCLEYKTPAGQTKTTSWSTGSSVVGSGRSSHWVIVQGNDVLPGAYEIKVKAKDRLGNVSETGYTPFNLFGGAAWNLNVVSVDRTSAVLSWERFPQANENPTAKFGKYVLTVGNLTPVEITSVTTTRYTVRNLTPNTTYAVTLHAGFTGRPGYLAAPTTVNLTTTSSPPVVGGFAVTPATAATNQDIQATATINDPDSNIKTAYLILADGNTKQELSKQTFNAQTVSFSHTFKVAEAGQYKLVLEAADEAGTGTAEKTLTVVAIEKPVIRFETSTIKALVGEEFNVVVLLSNADKLQGKIGCTLDWGDGQKSEIAAAEGAFKASHAYKDEGSFKVAATAVASAKGVSVASEPVQCTITVTSTSTQVTLTRDTSKGYGNSQVFHAKAVAGSYPIKTWTLDYGDGKKETGQGPVDKDFAHVYPGKGSYSVKLEVFDAKDKAVSKTVVFKIANDIGPDNVVLGTGTATSSAAQVTLTRDTATRNRNDQVFRAKVVAGSSPIRTWTLDFGDGGKESGRDAVDRDFPHVYLKKGSYTAKLEVVDAAGKVISKTVAVSIAADAELDKPGT